MTHLAVLTSKHLVNSGPDESVPNPISTAQASKLLVILDESGLIKIDRLGSAVASANSGKAEFFLLCIWVSR